MSLPTDEVRLGRDARHLNVLYTPDMIARAKGVVPLLAKDGGQAYPPAYSGLAWDAPTTAHGNYVFHANEELTVQLTNAYAEQFGADTLVVLPPQHPWAADMSRLALRLGDDACEPSRALHQFAEWLVAQLAYSRLVNMCDGAPWAAFVRSRNTDCAETSTVRMHTTGGRPEGDPRVPHAFWNLSVSDPYCYVARASYLAFLTGRYATTPDQAGILPDAMTAAMIRHTAAFARAALLPCPAPEFLPETVRLWVKGARVDSGCESRDENGAAVYVSPMADPAFSYDMCRLLGCWSLAGSA